MGQGVRLGESFPGRGPRLKKRSARFNFGNSVPARPNIGTSRPARLRINCRNMHG